MTESGSKAANGDASSRVAFDYIKGQFFRVIHADGVIGSLTPSGHIHFALFSERPAIPRRLVYELHNGQPTNVIPSETVARDAIIREIDVDVHMTLPAAKAFNDWLTQRIKELQAQIQPPQGNS